MIKTAIVSGAGGGLGKEVVSLLNEYGYRIIALDINPISFNKLSGSGHVECYELDVTDHLSVRLLAEELKLDICGVDLLICMAGIYATFPVTEALPDSFRRIMEVNFMATAILIQVLYKPLLRNQGRVVVVSSESHKIQSMFQPYMISKAALEAYCRVAWQELSLKGIKLSVIRPGAINTPLLKWIEITGKPEGSIYNKEFNISLEASKNFVGKIIHPKKVALKIIHAAHSRKPKRYYRINNNPLLTVISYLPSNWLDSFILFKIRRSIRK